MDMAVDRIIIPGTVKDGVVVPATGAKLPEGAEVHIVFSPLNVPPELQAEFTAWEAASDEAWGMIDQWEKEEQP
jgi:hypothetical protein